VKVYNEKGIASKTDTGMFPRALMQRLPLLPMEEEGRLNDLPLRENFIERVFHSPDRRLVRRAPTQRSEGAYYRWSEMLKTDPCIR